jgi:tripartite ATP-independent transporter DctM subunit
MGLFLMVSAYIISRRRGYGSAPEELMMPLLPAARAAVFPLLAPAIIIGGIFTGVFTPTEAAVVASIYALILGICYRELNLANLRRILLETVITTSIVVFILAGSSVGGWLVALEQVPQTIVAFFRALTDNPFVVLLFINVLLLFLGMLMDGVPIMIILFPVLMPLVKSYGIDPIHFGVMAVLNLMIGLITPPVGMVMYVVCSISKLPIQAFAREAVPFIVALILVLILITYIPPLVTFIPNLALGR